MTSERRIKAWIGFTDGTPYKFTNENGQKEWCVFRTRADGRKAFQDIRRCTIIAERRV